jgi:hypothetical protein
MPVILDGRAAGDWMSPREGDLLRLKSLLVPAPEDNLVLSPASSLVNSVNNDGPELVVCPTELSRRDGAYFRKLNREVRLMVALESDGLLRTRDRRGICSRSCALVSTLAPHEGLSGLLGP